MFQKQLSFQIVKLRILVPVNLTIKFDRKLFRDTKEIEDVIPDTMLSAKLTTIDL